MTLDRRTFLAALAAVPATAVSTKAAERTGTLAIAVQRLPRLLDPVQEISNVGFRTIFNLLDTVLDQDFTRADLPLQPGLAVEWARRDPSTLEVRLREGVRFHNGDLLTSEDLVASFGPKRLLGEGAPGSRAASPFWSRLERVEAVAPLVARFVMKGPDPLLERRLSNWAGQVISGRALAAAPSWEAWGRQVVGTGPYRLGQFRPGEILALDAFEGWWGGTPPFARVEFREVPEVAARIAGLAAGDYHIVTDLPADSIADVEGRSGLAVVGGRINNIRVLVWNTVSSPLADVRLRHALSLGIDRSALVKALWADRLGIPTSLQWESYGPLYDAARPGPSFDPDAARRLVREAGAQGSRLVYRVMPNYYASEIATAELLVEMWRGIGLQVAIEVREPAQQNAPGMAIRNWSNTALYPDPIGSLVRLYGTSSFVQVQNFWRNDAFNRDAEVLNGSVDVAERAAAHRRMLDIYDHADPPGCVLHHFGMFYGQQADLGWRPYEFEVMDLRPVAFKRG